MCVCAHVCLCLCKVPHARLFVRHFDVCDTYGTKRGCLCCGGLVSPLFDREERGGGASSGARAQPWGSMQQKWGSLVQQWARRA